MKFLKDLFISLFSIALALGLSFLAKMAHFSAWGRDDFVPIRFQVGPGLEIFSAIILAVTTIFFFQATVGAYRIYVFLIGSGAALLMSFLWHQDWGTLLALVLATVIVTFAAIFCSLEKGFPYFMLTLCGGAVSVVFITASPFMAILFPLTLGIGWLIFFRPKKTPKLLKSAAKTAVLT